MGLPPVVRLDLAVVSLPDWHPEAESDPTIPVYGYVVDHPDGAIVFDTGVGFGNEFVDEVYAPNRVRLDAALERVGVDASSVAAVVNSHLHFDHCGQNPLFYGSTVPVFAQASEYAAVDADPFYTDSAWALPPSRQRRTITGDCEIADGVTVVSTPGHTEGHQSLVVRVGDEVVVIAGQCVWRASEYIDDEATDANIGSAELRPAAIDSIRRIKALRPSAVHFAHCAALP